MYGVQRLTDEEIIGVLRSRIDASRRGGFPSSTGQIPILEAHFRAEVLQCAESVGIAMELELEYPVPSVFGETDYNY